MAARKSEHRRGWRKWKKYEIKFIRQLADNVDLFWFTSKTASVLTFSPPAANYSRKIKKTNRRKFKTKLEREENQFEYLNRYQI